MFVPLYFDILRWSNFFNYYFVEKNFNFNLQYFIRIKLDRYVIDSREINKFIFAVAVQFT